jgi:hypothetical protein
MRSPACFFFHLIAQLSVIRATRKYNINKSSDNLKPAFKNALLLAYVRARSKSRLASL